MNTAARLLFALGLTLAAAGFGTGASSAEAQDVQVTGPLAGAPAVRKMRVYRDGRFELKPTVGATLNDQFSRTMLAGLQIGYHLTDWLGIHAMYNYGVYPIDTSLTDQIVEKGITTDFNRLNLPNKKEFSKQIGRLKYLATLQATFIPLRGKLALFQALFVDTDFYLFGGAAFAGVEERADVSAAQGAACATPGNTTCYANTAGDSHRTSRMAIAATFGAGLSMFFNDYFAMTLEYRAFPFRWNNSGTDEAGMDANRKSDSSGAFPDGKIDSADRLGHFNQMFSLGFAFYFPTAAVITD
jgi:outer membrane beta-barrel protein